MQRASKPSPTSDCSPETIRSHPSAFKSYSFQKRFRTHRPKSRLSNPRSMMLMKLKSATYFIKLSSLANRLMSKEGICFGVSLNWAKTEPVSIATGVLISSFLIVTTR